MLWGKKKKKKIFKTERYKTVFKKKKIQDKIPTNEGEDKQAGTEL